MQTADGGLSYWPGGRQPMFWGSAYGGMALVLAARGGVDIPAPELERLLRFLSEELRKASLALNAEDYSAHLLALHTLAVAGRPETGYAELLYAKRALPSPIR